MMQSIQANLSLGKVAHNLKGTSFSHALGMSETKGQRAKARRTELGLNQTDVARLVGTTQQTISNFENDKWTDPKYLPKIAAALKLTAEWLRTGKGSKDAAQWDLLIDLADFDEDGQHAIRAAVDALRRGVLTGSQFAHVVDTAIILRNGQDPHP
jgi:transcriptional regulator with XRE-family HTH domain